MQNAMALATTKTILSFSLLSSAKRYRPFLKFPKNPSFRVFPGFRSLCSTSAPTATIEPPESPEQVRHSILLDRLRARHLKGPSKTTPQSKTQESLTSIAREGKGEDFDEKKKKKKKVVSVGSFEELGLSEEIMGAVREMGIEVPTEIQCIGIPAVLDGKSVVLGSHTGSGKTLAYMLPLVQVNFCFCLMDCLFGFVNFGSSFDFWSATKHSFLFICVLFEQLWFLITFYCHLSNFGF